MNALRRAASHALFGTLGGLALWLCVHVCSATLGLVGQPFLGFSVTDEGLVNPTSLQVWGADAAGIERWDRVIAVDGQLVFSGRMIREAALSQPVGTELVYQLEGRDGDARFVSLPTREFAPSDIVRSHASSAFLGLIFVGIAVLLYIVRPGTRVAWAFFLFFASVGVAMASAVDLTLLWTLPPIYPYLGPYLGFFGLVLVGVVTRAYDWRAEGDDEGTILRRVMWGLTGLSLAISTALAFGLYLTAGDISLYLIVDRLMYAYLAACTGTGLVALLMAFRRARSAQQRARLRQILWAWPVGAGIPTVNLFFGQWLELFGMSLLWNGFILLVPLSTADAIIRHDLLKLTDARRRLVGGVTVAAVIGMGLGFVMWAAVAFLRLTDAAGMVALAALLFAVAAPFTHRVQRYADNLLRSAPYDAGQLLAKFTAQASTAKHLSALTEELTATLHESLQPARVALFRLDLDERTLSPVVGDSAPIVVDEHIERLLVEEAPVLFDEDRPPPDGLAGAALAMRLAVAGEPVGLLALAERAEGRPLEVGDVAFAASLAGPLAAALVNTRAYEEIETLNLDLENRVVQRTHELAHTNEELERLNARKDELVATVSHDFRSPLASIRQNVQTILRDLSDMDAGDLRHFLEGIARQEVRLSSMSENLLDLARLKETRAPEDDVDTEALVRGLLDGFAVRAEQAGITLEMRREADAPVHVRGDADRLGQVLQNLVDNALKFTPAGGTITVALRRVVADDGPRLAIDVADTGCGIPADALPRLFEPFFQVPRPSHAGQGSGLGLAIVKAVIEAHGGTIRVDSDEDTGTTFHIELPGTRTVQSNEEPPSDPTTESESESESDPTVRDENIVRQESDTATR